MLQDVLDVLRLDHLDVGHQVAGHLGRHQDDEWRVLRFVDHRVRQTATQTTGWDVRAPGAAGTATRQGHSESSPGPPEARQTRA